MMLGRNGAMKDGRQSYEDGDWECYAATMGCFNRIRFGFEYIL